MVWLALSIFGIFQGLIDFLPQESADKILSLLLALALAVSYIMTYPALENDSPTLKLVYLIAQKGRIGATEEVLFKSFSNKNAVEPSITEMISEGLVRIEDESILLTERGHRLARVYRKWRTILGAEMGG
jgi:predicted transcriptional regulator